jgi:hypothetical protein
MARNDVAHLVLLTWPFFSLSCVMIINDAA